MTSLRLKFKWNLKSTWELTWRTRWTLSSFKINLVSDFNFQFATDLLYHGRVRRKTWNTKLMSYLMPDKLTAWLTLWIFIANELQYIDSLLKCQLGFCNAVQWLFLFIKETNLSLSISHSGFFQVVQSITVRFVL